MTQLSLTTEYVELTPEVREQRGIQLANRLRSRAQLLNDHAERRAAMTQEVKEMDAAIASLAEIVRSGREERPAIIQR